MKSWGSDIISKDKWIDTEKEYRTRSGKRVIYLEIVMNNAAGREVTFPVKGNIVIKEKPLRTTYNIWTLDGREDLRNDTMNDLVKV